MICKDGKTALFSFLLSSILFMCLFVFDALYSVLFRYSVNAPYVFVPVYLFVINVLFILFYKGHDYQVSNICIFVHFSTVQFYCRLQCVL